jgi:UPF0271 protein
MTKIDINADLGEGSGNDEELMPLISSCSIACGGHYGDENTMRRTVRLAKKYNVKVGAHPSFPDKDNFGRKVLTLTKRELKEAVLSQIMGFLAVCKSENVSLHHIKLHGALYNYAAKDAPTSDAVVEAILATKLRPKLYLPFNSVLSKKAENLLPLVYEAFIDRRYNEDLSLVSRSLPEATLTDPKLAWEQLLKMVEEGKVNTIGNSEKEIVANTYCVHSDTPNAVKTLEYIHSHIKEHAIVLKK